MFSLLSSDEPQEVARNFIVKVRTGGRTADTMAAILINRAGVQNTQEAVALGLVMKYPELLDRDTCYRSIDDDWECHSEEACFRSIDDR